MPDVFHGSAQYPSPSPGPVVTIGNFDGVHRGHRHLIARTTERAATRGAPACVYTFDPAPRDVLRPGNPIPRIQSLDDRIALLGAAGVDHVVIEPFDRAFAEHGAEWFAREILGARLGAVEVVVGFDFRFGKGREGTAEALGAWLDVPVHQIGPLLVDGEPASSSRIREAVHRGDVGAAALLLGRPHELLGEVVPGDARGRSLGFPTANVAPETLLVPADGVYAAVVETEQRKRFFGVVNIGTRPTFDGSDRRVEVHLLDVDKDLYGERLRVGFVERLRGEVKFDSLDALVAQIRADIARAREILERGAARPDTRG